MIFVSPWLLLIFIFLPPVLLVLSQLLLSPLEFYQKQKILLAAKRKMEKLPNTKVVAIVGSFAKTSTKDMLYTLLWKDFNTVKTPKSYNTPLSIARTILSDLKDNTEIFIVEMDAYHPGDIRELCRLVKPDMGIITAIASQHLMRFGSIESLAKAQFELAEELPKDGLIFLNSTDNWTVKLSPNYQNKKVFFGDTQNDFYATNILQTKEGLSFNLHTKKGEQVKVELPLLGVHNVTNFLAAASIAYNLGLGLKRISERAKKILPTPHRLEIKRQGSLTIIDNTYNTNPTASKASLKLLRDLEGTQKILITPGLVELGKDHFKENQNFGKEAGRVADEIIVVGENAKGAILKGLEESKFPKNKTHLAQSTQSALNMLGTLTKPGAVVLLENDLPDQYF